jgi:hypothetical protein
MLQDYGIIISSAVPSVAKTPCLDRDPETVCSDIPIFLNIFIFISVVVCRFKSFRATCDQPTLPHHSYSGLIVLLPIDTLNRQFHLQ